MSISITDATANTQRLAVDNSSNVELGSATPSTKLTAQGRNILVGSNLAPTTAAPSSMSRITGAVAVGWSVQTQVITSVTVPSCSGFGSVDDPDTTIIYFDSSKTSFGVITKNSAKTVNYSVF